VFEFCVIAAAMPFLSGEFKCLNCCYETNFKSHLDAHMRLHPEKPFQCNFCSYASYWRGDTKKHIEKNHPEMLPEGINPYNLVEQKFEVNQLSIHTRIHCLLQMKYIF